MKDEKLVPGTWYLVPGTGCEATVPSAKGKGKTLPEFINSESMEHAERRCEKSEQDVRNDGDKKENLSPTPPIREKDLSPSRLASLHTNLPRPRAREACVPPTLEEAHAYAAEANLAFDVDAFWDYYEIRGWTVRGSPVCNWKALMREWGRRQARWRREEAKRDAREARRLAHIDARMDARDEKRTAHIDAKMDAREAKREKRSRSYGRRKADNNVEMTDEVREEVRRDFSF